jgi:hypothetical protein
MVDRHGFESEAELRSFLERIRVGLERFWSGLRQFWYGSVLLGARDFEFRIGLRDRQGGDIYVDDVNLTADPRAAFNFLCKLLARFNLAGTIHVGPIHRGCWACETSKSSPTRFVSGSLRLKGVLDRLIRVVAQQWEDTAIVEVAPSAYDLEDLEKYVDWIMRVFRFLSAVCRYLDQNAIYVDAKPIAGWRSRLLNTWLECNQISRAVVDLGNIVKLLRTGRLPERS